MIRTLFICSALVASSGAGAVALSALHDVAGNQQVRTLAPVPVAVVEPRFIIPNYAPRAQAPEVIEVALRDAPSLSQVETASDVTPGDVSSPDTTAGLNITDGDGTIEDGRDTTETSRPTASRPSPEPAHRSNDEEPTPRIAIRDARPVIVAQAPAFTPERTAALRPDYMIGVFR